MEYFTIIPILGRKTDVNQADSTLFQMQSENVAITHDVGGKNFDLNRRRNVCTKSYAPTKWANSAISDPTGCQGLFDLYDGTNRDYIAFDHGKFYVYDAALDPQDKTAAGITHHPTNLISAIRVGSYIVWCDGVEVLTSNPPYAWKNGDATATKLYSAGTDFKFKYLEYFSNRIIGVFSDQTNGDIDIRWSGVIPVPGSSCEFVAGNQLFIPNDDPITGIGKLGSDRCYVYSEDSIHQIAFYSDYTLPFRCYTLIPNQGCVGHHSIVNVGSAHFFFNKNYGFCRYSGSGDIVPISDDILYDIQQINSSYYSKIVGTYLPLRNLIVWTVASSGESDNNSLFYYDIKTGQWTIEDVATRYITFWNTFSNFTWNDLISELGGSSSIWTDAGISTWAYYVAYRLRMASCNTDGWLRLFSAEATDGTTALDSYRIEPIMDFGDKNRKDLLKEIWVQISEGGNFNLTFWHRSGNTIKEVQDASWGSSIGTISCNNPEYPVLYVNKPAKLHQIKWGTPDVTSKYQVVGIKFGYEMESKY